MKKPDDDNSLSRSLKTELQDIKKLLILYASKSGSTSDEIGKVLGVGGSQIRNILAGQKSSRERNRDSKG